MAGLDWPTDYLRAHVPHLAIVSLLALYPSIYHLLANSLGLYEAEILLPGVETMTAVLYFGLFAMSFDFISGYTGYLSFGHAAFYGTGAYTVILVANGAVPLLGPGTPFVVSLLVAGLLAVLLALVVGLVSFRLSGVYFAMITLGFAQVLYVFIRGWDYVARNPRDGPSVGPTHSEGFQLGVPGVDQLNVAIGVLTGDEVTMLGHTLGGTAVSYYAIGAVVLLCYFAMQRIIHSPFGRVMIAIRENEERAVAIGYDTYRYKLAAFAVSGFFAAIAGGLFAGFRRSASPENSFYFLTTGDALLASIIGGFGTLAGPLFGRLFDETVREFLSKSGQGGGLLPYLRAGLGEETLSTPVVGNTSLGTLIDTLLNGHASLYIGIVFVLFVLYVPDGLLGTVRQRVGGKLAHVSAVRFGDGSTANATTDDATGEEE
ncbi:branched-chain amino acid ABC transporter permease [Haloarcula pellucida]|uniref:Branched-chain amino acid ABC transporter permease n=1 Tax=Haloarcula pellucida TaxID=1427151 RepID=A0A830GJS0_9EURY|nr:branched-chain amino acid ABC transporter permease [Halomicroarcula pellucida]